MTLAPDPAPVTLAFLGDVMLGRGVEAAHADKGWNETWSPLAAELQNADFALANLESPLTAASLARPTYDLRASPENAAALALAGLDLLSLANNHLLDAGQSGLRDTQEALAAHGLTGLQAGGPAVFRALNGQRFAFLAFEDVSMLLDLTASAQAVADAKAGADWVVVSLHWGGEYQPSPDLRQQKIAQTLADAGADLIWGHHPHVLQRLDWVQGKDRPTATLVLYSLGNALFDQIAPPDARRSALVLVAFSTGQIEPVRLIPFQIDPIRGSLTPASSSNADKIARRLSPSASPPK